MNRTDFPNPQLEDERAESAGVSPLALLHTLEPCFVDERVVRRTP